MHEMRLRSILEHFFKQSLLMLFYEILLLGLLLKRRVRGRIILYPLSVIVVEMVFAVEVEILVGLLDSSRWFDRLQWLRLQWLRLQCLLLLWLRLQWLRLQLFRLMTGSSR
jgi:hypothetical protein